MFSNYMFPRKFKYSADKDSYIYFMSNRLSVHYIRTIRVVPPYMPLRPSVHKAFQNQDQDQAQVKNASNMDLFKTYCK